jgi:hypothetical protein
MKYLNIKRYKFTTLQKNFDKLRFYFLNSFKNYNLRKFVSRLPYKYFNLRNLNVSKITKRLNLSSYKYLPLYFIASAVILGFVYVIIPLFFNYDKSILDNTFCKNKNIECEIQGKVSYSFYPSPRITIENLIINDSLNKINKFIIVKNALLILSFENLLNSKIKDIKKIKLNDFKINVHLEKIQKYNASLRKFNNLVPIVFSKGEVIFYDKKSYVASISDARIRLNFTNKNNQVTLKGKILNDDVVINLNIEKVNDKNLTELVFKLSNLNIYTKAKYTQTIKNNSIKNGNILIKFKKNKLKAIFDYEDEKVIITKSELRNGIIDGKLEGIIELSPYFNFNLDLNLNSLNFTKLYSYLLTLDHKKLFEVNKKINGNLNLSSAKIYSGLGLIKSFESRFEFKNGDILIEQLLLNMGKIGAADLLGTIVSDKNYKNFKFESNIFVDNQKKFLSKFGIYNKNKIPSNLFISGNFDLKKLKIVFYEISDEVKLKVEDIAFVEDEFNIFMLESGFKSLFNFQKFKNFLKSTMTEIN